MYLARFAFVYARARADVFFFFLSRVNLQPTWVLIIPLTRVAKINRVSRNHREDRRRETDVQNNFFSSQQTTQLTQFSAVSSQFKNRTVAKVRAFRTIWVVFLYHKKSSHNEKRRGENERLIAISDNVEFLSRLSLSFLFWNRERGYRWTGGERLFSVWLLFCASWLSFHQQHEHQQRIIFGNISSRSETSFGG